MKICYQPRDFQPASRRIIAEAADICEDYAAQGYDLTLRQLYYVFVSRDAIPNTEQSYKRLGSIVNDARLAGYLDWDWLVDRGRQIDALSHWAHPRRIIETAASQFHLDWWHDQPLHVEVWVEKQALAGVVERVCNQYDVTSLACKGYMSQSEQHAAGMRMLHHIRNGKRVHVLHLGDHDPSGIDMTRDNEERLRGFIGHHIAEDWDNMTDCRDEDGAPWWDILDEMFADVNSIDVDYADGERPDPVFTLERIALNRDQIDRYNPPPNPAKITDSRAEDYIARHGRQSWELDALPPQVLNDLIQAHIVNLIDDDAFDGRRSLEAQYKARIADLLDRHGDILDEVAT